MSDESRPRGGAAHEAPTKSPNAIVPPRTDNGTRDTGCDLTVLTDDQIAFYEAGVLAGIGIGREQAEAELQAAWSVMAAKIRHLGSARSMSYAALSAVRQEPDRAARGRRQTARVMA